MEPIEEIVYDDDVIVQVFDLTTKLNELIVRVNELQALIKHDS